MSHISHSKCFKQHQWIPITACWHTFMSGWWYKPIQILLPQQTKHTLQPKDGRGGGFLISHNRQNILLHIQKSTHRQTCGLYTHETICFAFQFSHDEGSLPTEWGIECENGSAGKCVEFSSSFSGKQSPGATALTTVAHALFHCLFSGATRRGSKCFARR